VRPFYLRFITKDIVTNKERSIPQPSDVPPVTPPGHDIFTDPALSQTVTEDPLFRFLQSNWRQVLLVVGFIVAVVYARQVFHDTRVADMERSADIFNRARSEYEQIVSLEGQLADARKRLGEKKAEAPKPADQKATDKKEQKDDAAATRVADLEKQMGDARRRIEGHLGSLADARSPYRELGDLYKGLLAQVTAADGKGAAELRAAIGVPTGSVQIGEKPDLATELKAMALARALIDSGDTRNEGVTALNDLATKGNFTRVSAGLTLAHIANSPEERQGALRILEAILTAQPEQESILGPEIARLKGAQ